jgi:hypothetical protein
MSGPDEAWAWARHKTAERRCGNKIRKAKNKEEDGERSAANLDKNNHELAGYRKPRSGPQ